MSGEIPGAGQQNTSEGLESSLSPRQEDRLHGFETLVERISLLQEKLDNGEEWEMFVKNELGAKIGGVPITQETVDTWKQTAFHMYEDFQSNPAMAARAREKIEDMKAQEEEKVTKETENLRTIWDKSTEDWK